MKRAPITRKTPLRKRSPKRAAYMKSAERTAGVIHMLAVKALGCMICGQPAEFHHEGKPRNDFRGLPLCPLHHKREYGPGAYHYSPKAFYALHGSSEALLARVAEMLAIPNNAPRTP
jgi:hypothetical protein